MVRHLDRRVHIGSKNPVERLAQRDNFDVADRANSLGDALKRAVH